MTTLLAILGVATEAADGSVATSWWEQWLSPAGISEAIKNGGLVLLAWLFFTGKIITSKQHDARIADLVKQHDARSQETGEHHARELAQKDESYAAMVVSKDSAYAEMKESRDYYRGARLEEKARADRATDQLVESNEVSRAAAHALTALVEAAEGAAQ